VRRWVKRLKGNQLQASAVQTPAAVPLALVMLRSTKLPAATVTLPEMVQATPGDAVQTRAVSAMLPGVPVRNVTVMVLVCCEKTLSVVAVHPDGTQVRADAGVAAAPISVALALELFTE